MSQPYDQGQHPQQQGDRAFDPSALMGIASSFMAQKQGQQQGQQHTGQASSSHSGGGGGMDMGAIMGMASSALGGAHQGQAGNAPPSSAGQGGFNLSSLLGAAGGAAGQSHGASGAPGGGGGSGQGSGGGGFGSLLGAAMSSMGQSGNQGGAAPQQGYNSGSSGGGGLGSLLGALGGGKAGSGGGQGAGSGGNGKLDVGALMGLASTFMGNKTSGGGGSGGGSGGGKLDAKTLIKLASSFKGGSSGGSNSSMFSSVASSLSSREVDLSASSAPNASTLEQAHQRVADSSATVGAHDIGGAAAVHAMQTILGGNQGQPDAGAKNNLVAAAMSHASDLYDQKSQQGRVEGSKDDAVQKAGEYAMSLFPKEDHNASAHPAAQHGFHSSNDYHQYGGGHFGSNPGPAHQGAVYSAFPEPNQGSGLGNLGGSSYGGNGYQGGYSSEYSNQGPSHWGHGPFQG